MKGRDLMNPRMRFTPRGDHGRPSVASLARIHLPASCQCGATLTGRDYVLAAGFVHLSGAATCCDECPGCQCWTAAP